MFNKVYRNERNLIYAYSFTYPTEQHVFVKILRNLTSEPQLQGMDLINENGIRKKKGML